MAEDKEVLRSVWNGRIPISLQLAARDDITDPPEKYFLMAQRVSYFPVVLEKAVKYFQKYVKEKTEELWLEFEGQPLHWHYPVGVLRDLLTSADPSLPWALTVHFGNFPIDLLPSPSKEAAESQFMSSLKEADMLKHKGQGPFMQAGCDDPAIHLTGVCKAVTFSPDLLSGGQRHRLCMAYPNTGMTRECAATLNWVIFRLVDHGGEGLRHVPFRLYRPDKGFTQCLVQPVREDGQEVSLGMLISNCLQNEPAPSAVKINGIAVPMETPLVWLSDHLSHPDNFLHIVAI